VKTLNIYINNTKVEVEVDDDITEDEAEKIAEEISKDDFFNECGFDWEVWEPADDAIKNRSGNMNE